MLLERKESSKGESDGVQCNSLEIHSVPNYQHHHHFTIYYYYRRSSTIYARMYMTTFDHIKSFSSYSINVAHRKTYLISISLSKNI